MAPSRVATITEGEQAEILQLKAKVKDLQRQLTNERKCTGCAKLACLRCVNSGWRDSSDFNEMLSGFFDNILTTMRIPLLRRRLPSLFNSDIPGPGSQSPQFNRPHWSPPLWTETSAFFPPNLLRKTLEQRG